MLKGSCNCGAVRFSAKDTFRAPAACHCSQCRKQSGHYWASVRVMDDDLAIHGTPTWYQSSASARRGFCSTCGAFLFWKLDADSDTSVALGAIDGATGLDLQRHIYTDEKGDYYDVPPDGSDG